ncbi:hypothetical protein [Actinocorallia longicatena]|uniref:Uncharacterized protein n=1 Tax=Actinocorallia longicatena TaxID=111803 RepID=A0ABP6Q885_9ACTN
MTVHGMTLPGHPPAPKNGCRACGATLGRPSGDDTWDAWNSAADQGGQVLADYVREHSGVSHRSGCPFKDLPLSVLRKFAGSWDKLIAQARRL